MKSLVSHWAFSFILVLGIVGGISRHHARAAELKNVSSQAGSFEFWLTRLGSGDGAQVLIDAGFSPADLEQAAVRDGAADIMALAGVGVDVSDVMELRSTVDGLVSVESHKAEAAVRDGDMPAMVRSRSLIKKLAEYSKKLKPLFSGNSIASIRNSDRKLFAAIQHQPRMAVKDAERQARSLADREISESMDGRGVNKGAAIELSRIVTEVLREVPGFTAKKVSVIGADQKSRGSLLFLMDSHIAPERLVVEDVDGSPDGLEMLMDSVLRANPQITQIKIEPSKDDAKAFRQGRSRGLTPVEAVKETSAYNIGAELGFTRIDQLTEPDPVSERPLSFMMERPTLSNLLDGVYWRVVEDKLDPVGGVIHRAVRKGVPLAGLGVEFIISNYPRLAALMGFRQEGNSVIYYPDVTGINARIASLNRKGYGIDVRFWEYAAETGKGGEAPIEEYLEHWANHEAVVSAGGELHFHDLGDHFAGYLLMPERLVEVSARQAAALVFLNRLVKEGKIKNLAFKKRLHDRMENFARDLDGTSAALADQRYQPWLAIRIKEWIGAYRSGRTIIDELLNEESLDTGRKRLSRREREIIGTARESASTASLSDRDIEDVANAIAARQKRAAGGASQSRRA